VVNQAAAAIHFTLRIREILAVLMSAREQSSMVSGSGLVAPDSDRESRPLPPLSAVDSDARLPRLSGSETVINKSGPLAMLLPPAGDSPARELVNRLFPSPQDSGSSIGTHSPNGIELDHFRVEERIGMGGMGAVFRAVDTRLQRMVALKLLAPSQSYDEGSIKRFQNEARAAARLDHENVARVHYIGEERGLHFIAFEYVTGSTIRELIRRQHRISVVDTINYALQIAAALKHTSAMGVVHRDIKPSNIIITPSGRAKLVDLGLARNDTTASQPDLTLPGTTLGTFDYISPEQAKDPRSVDVRSDIYSLGCTLYHMLTGQPPYPQGTVLQKLLDHQGKEAPDPASINRRIPDFVSVIVRRMMNSDRNNRHQNADQLIRDLTYAAGQLGLRGVNPEGLVWVSSNSATTSWLAGNAGWLGTVAVLLGVVGIFHQFPEIGLRMAGIPPQQQPRFDQATGTPQTRFATPDTGVEPASNAIATLSTAESGGTAADRGTSDETGPSAAIEPDETLVAANTNSLRPDEATPTSPLIRPDEISIPPGELIPDMTKILKAEGPDTSPSPIKPPRTVETPEVEIATSTAPSAAQPTAVSTEDELPVALFTGDASLQRHYRTLEAACAAAEDGSTIELQFSNTLVEKSFRVSRKNLTIRAARGHTPTIEFVPSEIDSTDSTARMITLNAGPLRLVNVNLQMTVPDRPSADRYSLFGISRAGLLAMDRVSITVVNPSHAPASIIEIASDSGRMPADMPTTPATIQREELGLQATDCVFRGQSSFATISWPGQASFSIDNCVAGLDGNFVEITPLAMPTAARPVLDFSMEHLTARLSGSFLRFSGPVSLDLPTVELRVRNSVISSTEASPLVVSEIAIAAEDARRMLNWKGERNFFDSVAVFWSLEASDDVLSWDDWQTLWQTNGNVGSKNQRIDWMTERPFDTKLVVGKSTPAIWQLGPGLTELNPAIQGSTDGSDAGADLSDLPWVVEKPSPVSSFSETKSATSSTGDSQKPAAKTQGPTEISTGSN
jgi:eukaryotic-like serine/threonine-protein kinase